MTVYRVSIETAKPVAWATVTATWPRVYRVETDGGTHAAVARAVAEHLRKRPGWPVYEIVVARPGRFGFIDGERIEAAGRADQIGPSRRFRVGFGDRVYTVATWSGDFKAIAIATEEHVRARGATALDEVTVEVLGDGPRFGRTPRGDLIDFGYEWRV